MSQVRCPGCARLREVEDGGTVRCWACGRTVYPPGTARERVTEAAPPPPVEVEEVEDTGDEGAEPQGGPSRRRGPRAWGMGRGRLVVVEDGPVHRFSPLKDFIHRGTAGMGILLGLVF